MNTQRTYTQLAIVVLALLLSARSATAGMLTFFPTDDTYVKMNDVVYGHNPHLQIRNEGSSGIWEENVLIRFDLSEIPGGTFVESATLHLWYFDYHDTNPAGRDLTCHRILEDWDEFTVTGDTLPGYIAEACATSAVPGQPGYWMTWNVTAEVQSFVDDPGTENYGWLLKDPQYWPGAAIPRTLFRSKEYGTFTPYLEVVPEPATLALLAIGGFVLIGRRRAC